MRNSSTIWVWHEWSCRRGNGTKPTQNGERLRVRQRYDAIHRATLQETISEDEAWERAIEQSKYPSCWGGARGTAKAGKEVCAMRQVIRDVPQVKSSVQQGMRQSQAEQGNRWHRLHPRQKARV